MKKLFLHLLIVVSFLGCNPLMDKDKRKPIIFFGDSITEFGMQPEGYVSILKKYLEANKLDSSYVLLGKGIRGSEVSDLWNRVDKDVIGRHAAIVFIYIGINDVFRDTTIIGSPEEEQYKKTLTDLVIRIKADNAKVILCTPSVIGEKKNKKNPHDAKLDKYASIVRDVAINTSSEWCDLRMIFTDSLQVNNIHDEESGIYTDDGVHLNDRGNKLVADVMFPFIKP